MITEPESLQTIAQKIQEWKTARKLSDNELCKRYGELGSTKTFNRILEGDTSELKVDNWLDSYKSAYALMQLGSGQEPESWRVLEDLDHMKRVRVAAFDLLQDSTNNRLVIVEGEPGVGKTAASVSVRNRSGSKMVDIEANATWPGRIMPMLSELFYCVRVREDRKLADVPSSPAAALEMIIERMSKVEFCVVIDEAHHMGPECLNIIKTLINRTKCRFMLFAKPDLFRKLESRAYSECSQLTKNRLKSRVRLAWLERTKEGTMAVRGQIIKDVEKVLQDRLEWEDGFIKKASVKLADEAVHYGHWNFVDMVTRKCRELIGSRRGKEDKVDADTFASALSLCQSSR